MNRRDFIKGTVVATGAVITLPASAVFLSELVPDTDGEKYIKHQVMLDPETGDPFICTFQRGDSVCTVRRVGECKDPDIVSNSMRRPELLNTWIKV